MIRTLILDDDPLYARPLARQLRLDSGGEIEAVVALTPEEAVRLVQSDPQPFDAFLIDELLGAGKDGIRAMEDVHRASPDTESIILTGADDLAIGLRAYKAGAWDYLPKSVGIDELMWRLRSLHGLRMLNDATNRAQRASSFQEVAAVIVQGGLQLGFERARLWRLDESGQTLIGVSLAGDDALRFAQQRIPLAQALYVQRAMDSPQEMTLFHGEEQGPGYLARHSPGNTYRPPTGDWIVAPLRSTTQCMGVLVLDNAQQPREITAEQRRLLRQFCRAACGALERAQLHERVRQLNEIGGHIMTQAAVGSLDKVLKAVRTQIHRFTDAHNFIAALVEEEGSQRYLHYRLRYEGDRPQPPSWRPLSEPGMLAHLIERGEPLFLPDRLDEYRRAHGIEAFGKPAKSWMGVPLRVRGRIVGVIAVENNRQANAFTQGEFDQFRKTVEHIQGAIQVARLEEQQEQNSRRLHLLQRASEEMMRLADEMGEDALWRATLTAATADYGLQFNRAMLFLFEDGGTKVRGRAGIGHLDGEAAHQAWEQDHKSNLSFDQFLIRLRRGELKPTPVHCEVHGLTIELSTGWNLFRAVFDSGKLQRASASLAERRMPRPFLARFGVCDYAVVPLRAGSRVIGLAVVDNAHDGKPIRKLALSHLESLLSHAALTYESYKQRKAYERLNELTCKVLSHAGQQSLQATLTEICEVARDVAAVDCATIVPITGSESSPSYVLEQSGAAGWRKAMPVRQPRSGGVTEYVLCTGMLVVPDVAKHADMDYAGQPITEHPLIREEGIRSLIYAPIRAMETGETLGVLKLYYRSSQTFGKSNLTQVEMFVELAAVAIQNWRMAQSARAEAEAKVQASEREMGVHQRVMRESLNRGTTQEHVVRALLDATHQVLELPDVTVEVDLRVWEPPEQEGDEPREVRREFYRQANGAVQPEREVNLFRGIIGRAFRTGETQLARDVTEPEWCGVFYPFDSRDTRSQLVAPILYGEGDAQEVIGALSVESPCAGTFTEAHAHILERLAGVAALALGNAHRLESRKQVLETSKDIAAPIDLKRTLVKIKELMRKIAPDLSALMIWHIDMATKQLKLGAHLGVRDLDALHGDLAIEGGLIQRVLNRKRPRPLFAARASGHDSSSDFVDREGIQSFAALPLRAEDESVGVMVLSYRHPHRFSDEERMLFPSLADLAASSIRDAALLEFAKQQRDQLETAQKVAEAAATTSGQDEALRRIMARLKELYPEDAIAIYTYEKAEHTLEVTPASLDFYPFEDVDTTGTLNVDGKSVASCVARRALASRKVEYRNVPNVEADNDYLPGTQGTASEFCVSLMSVSGDLLGVLILESPSPDDFDEEAVTQIRSIARQISLVMERSYLNGQLVYHTAFTDAMAGFVELEHGFGRELQVIRNRAAWLLRKELHLTTEGRSWAQEIDSSATKLRQMFKAAQRGLHDEGEQFVLDPQLKLIVAEAIERHPNAVITPVWDLNCDCLQVEANRRMLGQVLWHLVGNATRAMENVGRLIIRSRLRAGQWAEVQVEDSGPGVDEALRSILFQRPIPGREGHGKGLLLARRYVESMGGTIRLLDHKPGHGAIFAITLRIVKGVATPQ